MSKVRRTWLVVCTMIAISAIAPIVTAWQHRYNSFSSLPYSGGSALYVGDRVNTTVEIFIDGWINITSYVRTDDGNTPVTITRGEASEQTDMPTTELQLKLNNRNGLFSPRNPMSPYFNKIGRNTPIRVKIGDNVRFVGEIAELPQRWDATGQDAWVPLTAAGIKRRLSQGAKPIKAPLNRTIENFLPQHYYPCDDPLNTILLNDVGQGNTALLAVNVSLNAVPGPDGSPDNVCDVATSGAADIAMYSNFTDITSSWTIEFGLMSVIAGATSSFTPVMLYAGTYRFSITFENIAASAEGTYIVKRHYDDGSFATLLTSSGTINYTGDGVWRKVRLTFIQVASAMQLSMQIDGRDPLTYPLGTGTTAALTRLDILNVATSELSQAGIGHIVIYNNPVVQNSSTAYPDTYQAFYGFTAERAVERIKRLCIENNIHCIAYGESNSSTQLGAQPRVALLDIFKDAITADGGILIESRNDLGFAVRDRKNICNQSGITIDYSESFLSNQLAPLEDDISVTNDVTVKRTLGGSFRYIKTDGVLDPETIGVYDIEITLNLYNLSEVTDAAAWRVHLGTCAAVRIPEITIELHRQCFRTNPALINALAALDIGSVLFLNNLPMWIPNDIALKIAGYEEQITNLTWTIVFNTVPADPWRIGVYDSDSEFTTSRYTPDYSYLASAITETTTTLFVTYTDTRWVTPADSGDAFPLPIIIGGELLHVTDVIGTASPQEFTVTRGINGISKAHNAGSELSLQRDVPYGW